MSQREANADKPSHRTCWSGELNLIGCLVQDYTGHIA